MILGGTVGGLFVVLVLVALQAGGDGAGGRPDRLGAGPSSSASVAEVATTAVPDLAPLAPVDTSAPVRPPSTRPPATTTTTAPVVGPRGAVLVPPPRPASRATGPDESCESMASAGWTATCEMYDTRSGRLVWLIETRPADQGRTAHRALILRQRAPSSVYDVALQAFDDGGGRFVAVNAAVADLAGDGSPEAVVGFRRVGGAAMLVIDVVEEARVAVHRELLRGSTRVSAGQLDTWAADQPSGASYVHDVIRHARGAWRIVASTREAGPPPPSQV